MGASFSSAAPLVFGLLLGACSSASRSGEPDAHASPNERALASAPLEPDYGVAPPDLALAYTEHVGVLAGAGGTNGLARDGVAGTDLGASFVHEGDLVFLFGDSLTRDARLRDRDLSARAPLAVPASIPSLRFDRERSGLLAPIAAPPLDLGFMHVPADAFVRDGVPHVFFAAGWDDARRSHARSVLAHGRDLHALTIVHDVASTKLVNVSVVVTEGGDAYVYGTGPFRKSAIYVARAPLGTIEDRASWTYWAGAPVTAAGEPRFVAREEDAVPILESDCAGELSVRRHPRRALYALVYACLSEPRGVRLHLASSPLGPWTSGTRIFDPEAGGYGVFMHRKESIAGYDDGLAPAGDEESWGGEYAPSLVAPWFEDAPSGAITLTYALSSWVPYSVHLMKTVLAPPGISPLRVRPGEGLPRAHVVNGSFEAGTRGWTTTGDAFSVYRDASGTPRLTTFTPVRGDLATGRLEQAFTVDGDARALELFVAGGDATVSLVRGGEVLRVAAGRRSHVPRRIRWSLEELRGETLHIVIDDRLTGPWGFVEAYGFHVD